MHPCARARACVRLHFAGGAGARSSQASGVIRYSIATLLAIRNSPDVLASPCPETIPAHLRAGSEERLRWASCLVERRQPSGMRVVMRRCMSWPPCVSPRATRSRSASRREQVVCNITCVQTRWRAQRRSCPQSFRTHPARRLAHSTKRRRSKAERAALAVCVVKEAGPLSVVE